VGKTWANAKYASAVFALNEAQKFTAFVALGASLVRSVEPCPLEEAPSYISAPSADQKHHLRQHEQASRKYLDRLAGQEVFLSRLNHCIAYELAFRAELYNPNTGAHRGQPTPRKKKRAKAQTARREGSPLEEAACGDEGVCAVRYHGGGESVESVESLIPGGGNGVDFEAMIEAALVKEAEAAAAAPSGRPTGCTEKASLSSSLSRASHTSTLKKRTVAAPPEAPLTKENRRPPGKRKKLLDFLEIDYRRCLVDFYAVRDPSKIAKVDQLLEGYKGRENKLIQLVARKYAADPAVLLRPGVATPVINAAPY